MQLPCVHVQVVVTAMHGGCNYMLLSKYTILYGEVMSLMVSIQLVARRWAATCTSVVACYTPEVEQVG